MEAEGSLVTVKQRRPYLYVGNLSLHVSERDLAHLFEQTGQVRSTKIVRSTNVNNEKEVAYGFVEYVRLASAEVALQAFQGLPFFGRRLRLNWAHQGANAGEPPTNKTAFRNFPKIPLQPKNINDDQNEPYETSDWLFVVFVGDLAPEVNDLTLAQAFSIFSSMYDARVIWDLHTQRSRGYGFVRFQAESDAINSIETMTGQWLGSRVIRVNWASRPSEPRPSCIDKSISHYMPVGKGPQESRSSPIVYGKTIYIGNVAPGTTLEELVFIFSSYGIIVNAQVFVHRSYAFLTFSEHVDALKALQMAQVAPLTVHGRLLKIAWARLKDRDSVN